MAQSRRWTCASSWASTAVRHSTGQSSASAGSRTTGRDQPHVIGTFARSLRSNRTVRTRPSRSDKSCARCRQLGSSTVAAARDIHQAVPSPTVNRSTTNSAPALQSSSSAVGQSSGDAAGRAGDRVVDPIGDPVGSTRGVAVPSVCSGGGGVRGVAVAAAGGSTTDAGRATSDASDSGTTIVIEGIRPETAGRASEVARATAQIRCRMAAGARWAPVASRPAPASSAALLTAASASQVGSVKTVNVCSRSMATGLPFVPARSARPTGPARSR